MLLNWDWLILIMEIIVFLALTATVYLYFENRKIKIYLAVVENRLRRLDQKESDEDGAIIGTLRDVNAHNVIFMGLLRENPDAATFIKEFAEDYPISSDDDVEVMKTVISLTKKWAR